MSNATIAKLTVEAKSKFGVLDSNTKKWMNPLNKSLLSFFELGKSYDVTMDKVKGDDGKVREYIVSAVVGKAVMIEEPRSIGNVGGSQIQPGSDKLSNVKVTEHTVSTVDKGLSFAEKDSRILAQGLVQAVLQSNLMNMIPDNVTPMKFVETTTVELMAIVKRLSGTK